MPLAYVKEFSKLQDSVPGFPSGRCQRIIERRSSTSPVNQLFAEIESEPDRCGISCQVYRARLHSGETVPVKVSARTSEKTINFDLAVLRRMARF
ncbi:MAG: hypothetical protein IPL01_05880 [Acidobacteria bacterium]|nr:hypothetical protein [Acidobacteriota bacterium]